MILADPARSTSPRRLQLPPPFGVIALTGAQCPFAAARELAATAGAGAFVWSDGERELELAVVLEPDEPLRLARRALHVGMLALAEAVASLAPPEKPVAIVWPDALAFDGARLGGGRVASPDRCDDSERPAWLVFGASLIRSKDWAGDPGLTPGSTSLQEEGFDGSSAGAELAEAVARHLLRALDLWQDGGPVAFARRYAEFAGYPTDSDLPTRLAAPMDAASVGSPSWLDPLTGGVRL